MEDIDRDSRVWNLNEADPCDKDVWRSSVRSVMRAVSQLPGGEPTDVDNALAPAFNQNADEDDDGDFATFEG